MEIRNRMKSWRALFRSVACELLRSRRIGLFCAGRLTLYRISRGLRLDRTRLLRLRPRGCRYPLAVRVPDSSDVELFLSVFVWQEYRVLCDIPEPKVIVDCGANVGYSSIYFLNAFPKARVIAIEPDPENFRICNQNLAPYSSRVQLLRAAVWGRSTRVAIQRGCFRDGREWATQVREANAGDRDTVDAVDMSSLVGLAPGGVVDLLKIDIERSELELFGCDPHRWLPSIRNIAIELHDEHCERVFSQALQGYSYDKSLSGELTICRNIRPKASVEATLARPEPEAQA